LKVEHRELLNLLILMLKW